MLDKKAEKKRIAIIFLVMLIVLTLYSFISSGITGTSSSYNITSREDAIAANASSPSYGIRTSGGIQPAATLNTSSIFSRFGILGLNVSIKNFPTVTLTNPPDNWVVNQEPIFECSVTHDMGLANVSLYTNQSGTWAIHFTNSSISGNSFELIINTTGFSEGSHIWNCYACDAESACAFASSNRSIIVDNTSSTISFVDPTPDNNTKILTTDSATINVSSSDENTNHSVILDWNNTLVGWWSFDNVSGTNVDDKSSYGNDGTSSGEQYQVEGFYGKGMKFDGVDDYVSIAHNDSLVLTGVGTLEVMVKIDSYPASYWHIAGKGASAGWDSDGYSIWYNTGSNNIVGSIDNESGGGTHNGVNFGKPSVDVWHHLALVWNGSLVMAYLDGETVASTAQTTNAGLTTVTFDVGKRGGDYYNGTIDEIKVHKRALSAYEINASYQASLYQYENTFSSLTEGATYTYKAYSIDLAGNINETEQRTLIVNNKPVVSNVILNATSINNLTEDNLTLFFSQTDADSDVVYNVTDWRKDGNSIAVLNMPFNTNISSITTNAIKDYSTYENNGTLGGGTQANAPNWTTNGKIGGAYEFDGIDDYINLGTSTSTYMNNTPFTVAYWAKVNGGKEQYVVSRFETATDYNGYRFGFSANGYYVFALHETVSGSSNNVEYTGSISYVDSNWRHYAFVGDEYNVSVYVNGTLIAAHNYTHIGPITPAQALLIGASYSGASQLFNGSADEILFFNRTLSLEQINILFQAGLAEHSVNTIVSNETNDDDNWTVAVTPSDGFEDGDTVVSNSLIVNEVTAPTYTDFQNNASADTTINGSVNWSITLEDETGLSSYIFSYNGTGAWTADDPVTISGTSVFVNVTKTVNVSHAFICGNFTFNDTSDNWNSTELSCFTMANTEPSSVVLSFPLDNATGTNRTPTFNWSEATDADEDILTYELLIERISCGDISNDCFVDLVNVTNISGINYTLITELDTDSPYNWSVRAYDGWNYSAWSSIRNYTVNSLVSLKFLVDSVTFSTLEVTQNENTTTNSPPPIEVENDGNVRLNLTIYANESLWMRSYAGLDTSYFQFMAGNTSEADSFNWSGSQTTWQNVSGSAINLITSLYYNNSKNTAEIELKIDVPPDEPPGSKVTGLVIEVVQP